MGHWMKNSQWKIRQKNKKSKTQCLRDTVCVGAGKQVIERANKSKSFVAPHERNHPVWGLNLALAQTSLVMRQQEGTRRGWGMNAGTQGEPAATSVSPCPQWNWVKVSSMPPLWRKCAIRGTRKGWKMSQGRTKRKPCLLKCQIDGFETVIPQTPLWELHKSLH